jgi:glycosyltransferase involved in cell wall biosynthesis
MACIIKLPSENSKGIISFTSAEHREVIPQIKDFLNQQRENWVYLLHHNWQPCYHDDFYDSSMCNIIDLQNGGECLDMDCCNFSPDIYSPSTNEKIFDVLYIARAVSFKRIKTFFDICKQLLQINPNIKILFICSIPEIDCDPLDPKSIYLNMFTREERKNFLALFFDYDYPFTVSKEFLAHFYKSSKIFLHAANEERHPRVCSYAWASGIPVVGYKNLATFLPAQFQTQPFFYQVNHDGEYVDAILKALDNTMPYDDIKYYVSEKYSVEIFKNKLKNLYGNHNLTFDEDNMYLKNLDFRMGRHCSISLGDNRLDISIPELMLKCTTHQINPSTSDLEKEIIQLQK